MVRHAVTALVRHTKSYLTTTIKSPASRWRLPHFGAISRSPAASLKSPASPALNLVSWFSAK